MFTSAPWSSSSLTTAVRPLAAVTWSAPWVTQQQHNDNKQNNSKNNTTTTTGGNNQHTTPNWNTNKQTTIRWVDWICLFVLFSRCPLCLGSCPTQETAQHNQHHHHEQHQQTHRENTQHLQPFLLFALSFSPRHDWSNCGVLIRRTIELQC